MSNLEMVLFLVMVSMLLFRKFWYHVISCICDVVEERIKSRKKQPKHMASREEKIQTSGREDEK